MQAVDSIFRQSFRYSICYCKYQSDSQGIQATAIVDSSEPKHTGPGPQQRPWELSLHVHVFKSQRGRIDGQCNQDPGQGHAYQCNDN